jgi:hypothetical protein
MVKARRAARVKVTMVVPVGLIGASQRLTGDLETLSPYGMFVRTAHEVPPGTALRVGIAVGHETFRAAAVVRHSEAGTGFAVEFIQMSSNDRALLRRLYLQFSPKQG